MTPPFTGEEMANIRWSSPMMGSITQWMVVQGIAGAIMSLIVIWWWKLYGLYLVGSSLYWLRLQG